MAGVVDLGTIISPHSVDDFLHNSLGKSFHCFDVVPGRFRHLLTWDTISNLLAHHRFDGTEFRLVKRGQDLPVTRYLGNDDGLPARVYSYVRPAELISELRDGAVMALNLVDRLVSDVNALAGRLQRSLGEQVWANAYIGWNSSTGFKTHWDDHDVFILQVLGRKAWKVFGPPPARPFPVKNDRNRDVTGAPPPSPIWDGVLEDGGALYIPRGWWHVAEALDGPTVHLTISITRRTGLDFLGAVYKEAQDIAAFREDLPRFASVEDQAEHAQRLAVEMARLMQRDLGGYLEKQTIGIPPRDRIVDLPSQVNPEAAVAAPDAVVELLQPVRVITDRDNQAVDLAAQDTRWRFPVATEGVLRDIAAGDNARVADLIAANRGISGDDVGDLLCLLTKAGVVVVRPGAEARSL